MFGMSKIKTTVDAFTGDTYHLMSGNKIKGKPHTALVELNAQKYIPKGEEATYQLFVHYSWTDWMFIDTGLSLMFLVDGERMDLHGMGSSDERHTVNGGVQETAFYMVTEDELAALAGAKSVRMRLMGSEYDIERDFDAINLLNLKDFIAKYVND